LAVGTGPNLSTPALGDVGASLAGLGEAAGKVQFDAGKLDILRTRPQLLLYALILISVFFLTFIVVSGNEAGALSLSSDLVEAGRRAGRTSMGGEGFFQLLSWLALSLWALVALIGFALLREIGGTRSRPSELGVAALCLFNIVLFLGHIVAFENLDGAWSDGLVPIEFGLGGWLITLCGFGLALTATGIVKTVPGWPAPEAAKAQRP
ncbi:MAG: hypothetical protein AAFY81_10715, partial [Pseudomonadota bacterium]